MSGGTGGGSSTCGKTSDIGGPFSDREDGNGIELYQITDTDTEKQDRVDEKRDLLQSFPSNSQSMNTATKAVVSHGRFASSQAAY